MTSGSSRRCRDLRNSIHLLCLRCRVLDQFKQNLRQFIRLCHHRVVTGREEFVEAVALFLGPVGW